MRSRRGRGSGVAGTVVVTLKQELDDDNETISMSEQEDDLGRQPANSDSNYSHDHQFVTTSDEEGTSSAWEEEEEEDGKVFRRRSHGLHHRGGGVRQRFWSLDDSDFATNNKPSPPDSKYFKPPRGTSGVPSHQQPQQQHQRVFCGKTVQTVLLIVALAYLALIMNIYRHILASDEYEKEQQQQQSHYGYNVDYETSSLYSRYLVEQQEKRQLARTYLDEKESSSRRSCLKAMQDRSHRRQLVTRPPSADIVSQYYDATVKASNDKHKLQTDTDDDDEPSSPSSTSTLKPAELEDLCGFFAQNASLSHPTLYPLQSALGPQSRVIITSILSDLGMSLALSLHQTCRVEIIIGMDAMVPNTVTHRLELMQRLQLLQTNIPKLQMLPPSYLGLEPLSSSGTSSSTKSKQKTTPLGETDWVQTHEPTHIVHLPLTGSTISSMSNHYLIRTSLIAMEQLLSSCQLYTSTVATSTISASSSITNATPTATAPPHLLFVTPTLYDDDNESPTSILNRHLGRLQHAFAKVYGQVSSVALGLPRDLVGPMTTSIDTDNSTTTSSTKILHLLTMHDAVQGLVAAMQFRPLHHMSLELAPLARMTPHAYNQLLDEQLQQQSIAVKPNDSQAAAEVVVSGDALPSPNAAASLAIITTARTRRTKQYLGWVPRMTLVEGVIRGLAWQLDQRYPHGQPKVQQQAQAESSAVESNNNRRWTSGDDLLTNHGLASCQADDISCHMGPKYVPCASECSSKHHCLPSMFDSVLPLMRDVTQDCDIILYTQALDDVQDLELETEYMEEGNPLICTLAFVNFDSRLVQSVLQKVPSAEMTKFGVSPRPQDEGKAEAIHRQKREKLNGRLLFRGWILVWPYDEHIKLSHADMYLLKMSPGRLFADSVRHAVFVEQTFGVSPLLDDIAFLADEMYRPAIPKRVVKRKIPTKAKYILPAEPERRAVLLISTLRYQESADQQQQQQMQLRSDQKISVREASRFMRFEKFQELGKEPTSVKHQREFYERATSLVNKSTLRSPDAAPYNFNMEHWVRSQWVMHDMTLEEGRQMRCDWYREHVQWESSPLDQLSFAYVMARRESSRRMAFGELDDKIRSAMSDHFSIKGQQTDAFEWHALETSVNQGYSPWSEMEILPYDKPIEEESSNTDTTVKNGDSDPLLFVRVVSDKVMSISRKAWNKSAKHKPTEKNHQK